jgi:type IV secretion system protein TrbE
MRLFAEDRNTAQGLSDLLLYSTMVEDGVLLLTDGSLLASWSYRGPDLDASTHSEMEALSARLNTILKLGSGWMIHADAVRTHSPEYPQSSFPDPITALIDLERDQQFHAEEAHFETEYFLTLTYQPPRQREETIRGWLFEGETTHQRGAAAIAMEQFRQKISAFEDVLGSLVYVERLTADRFHDAFGTLVVHDRLLRHLQRCVSGIDRLVELPQIPTFLNELIGAQEMRAGVAPRIGRKHLRVVAIDGFPRASRPGILRALDSLPLEYRWSTRAILLDPEEARKSLDKIRRKWRGKERGFQDQVLQTQSGAVDHFAVEMARDAEEAMSAATAGDVQFCQYTSVMVLTHEEESKVEEGAALAIKTITNLGFGARLEEINAVEAWRGSLPGDGYSNVRRIFLHTLNLGDLLPVTAVYVGSRENPSPLMPRHSPPLLYAATAGATPFRFHLHVGDLGHTLMIGPPGAGKSTFLGFIAAQWFRYPHAQVFAFDKGHSLQVLTEACQGSFYDIGHSSQLAFCPLADLETPADVAWAVDWLEALCTLQDVRISPSQRNALLEAVTLLRDSRREHRTLTELRANVQDEALREALDYFTLQGALGHLLDAKEDCLGSGRFLTFETEHLLSMNEKAVVPVLLYLFRQIEKRLDGRPTLVLLDEAWVFLRHPLFRDRLRDWLKTLRKQNGAVVLATQNLSDVFQSSIKDVVLESCPTKILLPNTEAANPASREFYDAIGLNEREIGIVQKALPKREYYIVSPQGRRKISLGLGGVALAFVGVSGKEERERALQRQHLPGDWRSHWLRERQLADWADFYERSAL